jgi:hypothetical protein
MSFCAPLDGIVVGERMLLANGLYNMHVTTSTSTNHATEAVAQLAHRRAALQLPYHAASATAAAAYRGPGR